MTSRALAGANPRKDAREAQFDGLECGELLHEGGAQSQIWLRQLNQNLQIAAPCGGAPRERAPAVQVTDRTKMAA